MKRKNKSESMENRRGLWKRLCAVFVLMLLLAAVPAVIWAEEENKTGTDQQEILRQQEDSGKMQELRNQLNRYSQNGFREIVPEFDPQKIMDSTADGKMSFSLTGIIQRLLEYLFKEFYVNLGLMIKLLVLVVICSILKNLQASFLSESVGEVAFYACYIVIVSIMVLSLGTVLTLARNIVDSMVDFMHATIPILITLLISGGNFTSAGVFQPILIMIVEISATIMKNVFLPLIALSVIVSIVDNISDKVQVSRMAAFFKQISLWTLGLMLTVFIGVVAIQGSLGAVVDGVTSKTAKFAIGAFIPVVGKYLADAADAVIGCTLLVKNAAGVAAMVGIIAICIIPLVKMFALIALYRITCIFVEPIADKRITNCINDVASSLTYVLGISAAVAFMFLISITAIIGASNIASMIR